MQAIGNGSRIGRKHRGDKVKTHKRTAHLSIHFHDMDVVDTDEAIETIKSVLIELEGQMHEKVARALEDIGAREVKLSIVVY